MKKNALFFSAVLLLLAAAGCTKTNLVNTWAGNGVLRPNAEDYFDSYMVYMTLNDDGTVTRFLTSVDDAFKPNKARQIDGVGSWTSKKKNVTVTLDPTWARFSWESVTTEYELGGQCLYLASGNANTSGTNAVNGPDGRVYQWMVSSYSM